MNIVNSDEEIDIASILLQLREAQEEEDEKEEETLTDEEILQGEEETLTDEEILQGEEAPVLLPWYEMTRERLPSYYLTEEEKEEIKKEKKREKRLATQRAYNRKRLATPEYREKQRAYNRRLATPEYLEKKRSYERERRSDPAIYEKILENQRKRYSLKRNSIG